MKRRWAICIPLSVFNKFIHATPQVSMWASDCIYNSLTEGITLITVISLKNSVKSKQVCQCFVAIFRTCDLLLHYRTSMACFAGSALNLHKCNTATFWYTISLTIKERIHGGVCNESFSLGHILILIPCR